MKPDHQRSLPRFDTPDGGRLIPEMQAAFRRSGVIILDDFVTPAACRELRQRAREIVDAFDPGTAASVFSTTDQAQLQDRYFIESGDRIRCFLEAGAVAADGTLKRPKDESVNKIGHALHDLDPVFERFSHGAALAAVAAGLGLSDPVIIQSMYIFKPPRIGGEVVCHQDSTYLYTEPESCIGFWFALEDATVENGCMYFIPGAHKGPLRQRNRRVGEFVLETRVLDDSPWPEADKLPAEAGAGALVVFDGRAPHLSGPNLSSRSRHAYTLHAIDRRCHYPGDNWLQRDPALPLRGFV